MKDLRFFNQPLANNQDSIAITLKWGNEQVGDIFTCHRSQMDFVQQVMLRWAVKIEITRISEIGPLSAKMIACPAVKIENWVDLVEWLTPDRIIKLRRAIETATEHEDALQNSLNLIQCCVAHHRFLNENKEAA